MKLRLSIKQKENKHRVASSRQVTNKNLKSNKIQDTHEWKEINTD